MIPATFPSVLDSSILAGFKSCAQKGFKEYFSHWKPKDQSVHLHAGAAFARGMEVARLAFYVEGKEADIAVAEGLGALLAAYGNFECPADSAKSAERMAGAFEFYFHNYPLTHEDYPPIQLPSGKRGIEFSFVEPLDILHPVTGEPLLYSGRLDALLHFAGGTFICDEKTTSSLGATWGRQWDLRSQFTGYCLLPGTEVLTRTGWKAIEKLIETEEVVQWDKSGVMSWTVPTEIHKPNYKGNLISCEGKVSFIATPEHRQIVWDTYANKWKVFTTETLPKNSGTLRFISAGTLEGGTNFPEAFIQLLVAIQADGSWKNGTVRFHFTKDRKARRLEDILESLDIPIVWHSTSDYSIQISASEKWIQEAALLLGPSKEFGAWLLNLGRESLKTFIEEVAYWDGSERGSRGWMYFSKSKINADWVRTVASITGHFSSWHTQNGSYRVNITEGCQHSPHLHTWGTIPYEGKVYCLSVPTSFFLIRSNGKTMITGNSWGCQRNGIKVDGVIVRGVSVLKTKYETQQAISYRPEWQIDRWHRELQFHVNQMIEQWKLYTANGTEFIHNLDHACAEYGGCTFRQICSMQPGENRDQWLEQYYEQREWNPITRLETKL